MGFVFLEDELFFLAFTSRSVSAELWDRLLVDFLDPCELSESEDESDPDEDEDDVDVEDEADDDVEVLLAEPCGFAFGGILTDY